MAAAGSRIPITLPDYLVNGRHFRVNWRPDRVEYGGATVQHPAAKRVFPLFGSANILGGVLSNLATGPLANLLGTENLILFYVILLGGTVLIVVRIVTGFMENDSSTSKQTSFLTELGIGYKYIRKSSLFVPMSAAAALFSILYFSVSFPFSQVVAEAFPDEASIAGFLGTFNSATTAITFLVSLLLANRLYRRIGIINAILLMPAAYLVSFVVFLIEFNLVTASASWLIMMVIIGGLGGTAYNTVYNVLPSDQRSQVLSFMAGVPTQIGSVISGILLVFGTEVLARNQMFVIGPCWPCMRSGVCVRHMAPHSSKRSLRVAMMYSGPQKPFKQRVPLKYLPSKPMLSIAFSGTGQRFPPH